ncbi:MAG: vitamin B12-dependent ribonucleotide reductase [Polyangia bacterium]|jgi:ribonucleoside-diphosphate reductase alpha chain|nr:vitamin B12-dependent ribonucleotide reductase [Polyangia bacterium]
MIKEETLQQNQQQDPHAPAASRQREEGLKTGREGLGFERFFTQEGVHPFDELKWERRTAAIAGQGGETIFEQRDVECPATWSQTALNIVVQKYFRGVQDSPSREQSIKDLINRVVNTLADWGTKQRYFRGPRDAEIFTDELTHLLVHQKASFNSPVWFNVGVDDHPQCSACFINSVEDTMDGILRLAHTEGMLFKWGSGTGTNFSTLRSSKELLNGGGTASGPVSFMRGFDAFAGVIKSGGKTRRAAKMVILNVDHPDIVEFITCKAREEQKAWTLIDAGYDGSFGGEAYASVMFQNSNNSVRVTDDFMQAVIHDRNWELRSVTDPGKIVESVRARDVMREISKAAHQCGDPGMQFDTTINAWNTCSTSGRINASNPCSEYMFHDNSACNLASLNLRKFLRPDGEFDVESFFRAVDLLVTAQEIIIDNARYPTPAIEHNSHMYRPLGLGFANLGALLMGRGLPYDSEPGRAYAAAITGLMTGRAYKMSARISRDVTGPFERYEENRAPFLKVIRKHRRHVNFVDSALVPYDLMQAVRDVWDDALEMSSQHGIRNAQVTVLAPTGTIGFMMDCDTTGIEPDMALVKYKHLVGGGMLKLVNGTVKQALERLGYNDAQVTAIRDHIDRQDTIEGTNQLKDEHLPVFDCALRPRNGTRYIAPMGHIRMMAAVQPFISGAISKTVNLPNDATVKDIENIFIESWRLGLKALAIYRDGCKRTQPINMGKTQQKEEEAKLERAAAAATSSNKPPAPQRRRLPDERVSLTHKFEVAGHEGYLSVGYYDHGEPGEIFIKMAKEGSTISGLMDAFATSISIALQHGVPMKLLCDKFMHTRFEPSGFTNNESIPIASSLMDYIFRYLALKHLDEQAKHPVVAKMGQLQGASPDWMGIMATKAVTGALADETQAAALVSLPGASASLGSSSNRIPDESRIAEEVSAYLHETDAPPCHVCGYIMVRNGACHKCENCGATSGCS